MFPGSAIRGVVFLALAASAMPASAAVFCVATFSQFQAALNTADANVEHDQIRLRQFTFLIPGINNVDGFSTTFLEARDLSITGGWREVDEPCDTQDPDPTLTIIDGNHATAGFTLRSGGLQGERTITIANLTVRNGYTDDPMAAPELGAAFALLGFDETTTILMDRLIIEDNHSNGIAPAMFVGFDADGPGEERPGLIVLANSVFQGNDAESPVVEAAGLLGASVVVVNNTFRDNGAGPSPAFPIFLSGLESRFFNNLLFENAINAPGISPGNPGDIRQIANNNMDIDAFFSFDVHENIVLGPGNRWAAPGFAAGTGANLLEASPMRDQGLLDATIAGLVGPIDLYGNPRVSDGAIDIGAFELASNVVFDDGFE